MDYLKLKENLQANKKLEETYTKNKNIAQANLNVLKEQVVSSKKEISILKEEVLNSLIDLGYIRSGDKFDSKTLEDISIKVNDGILKDNEKYRALIDRLEVLNNGTK